MHVTSADNVNAFPAIAWIYSCKPVSQILDSSSLCSSASISKPCALWYDAVSIFRHEV